MLQYTMRLQVRGAHQLCGRARASAAPALGFKIHCALHNAMLLFFKNARR